MLTDFNFSSFHTLRVLLFFFVFFSFFFFMLLILIHIVPLLNVRCNLQESKSIGAEVNWGVRFKNPKDVSIIKYALQRYFRFYILLTDISCNFLSRVKTSCQIFARRFPYVCKDVECRGALLPLKYVPSINFTFSN